MWFGHRNANAVPFVNIYEGQALPLFPTGGLIPSRMLEEKRLTVTEEATETENCIMLKVTQLVRHVLDFNSGNLGTEPATELG